MNPERVARDAANAIVDAITTVVGSPIATDDKATILRDLVGVALRCIYRAEDSIWEGVEE